MAGYATAAEIQSEFKATTFSTTSAVTDAELDAWSEEFSRLADGVISKRYTVPITDADGVNVMKLIVKSFVAARVMRILNSQQAVGETELNKALALEKFFKEILEKIAKGMIELPGAEIVSRLTPKSYNQENAVDPTWELNTDQW